MCWVSKELNKRVAKEDKIVYKRLIPISFIRARSPLYSEHTYIKNKVCENVNVQWETTDLEGIIKIEKGYHSYNSRQCRLAPSCECYEMVIPKGNPKICKFVDKLINFIYGTFGRIFSKNL